MASAKSCMMARRATTSTNYRFLSSPDPLTQTHHAYTEFELDESDVWGGSTRSDPPESRHVTRQSRKPKPIFPVPARTRFDHGGVAASVPVNIPDWSKILRDEYKDKFGGGGGGGSFNGGGFDLGGGDDGGDDEEWVPPHEYLARTRNASFSVQEGIGRTLKGRDLSRVRNAIWEKTGFQD